MTLIRGPGGWRGGPRRAAAFVNGCFFFLASSPATAHPTHTRLASSLSSPLSSPPPNADAAPPPFLSPSPP